MAFFFSESLLNISFLISELSQGVGLFRTFITFLGACLLRILRKLLFQMCHVSLILTKLESNCGKWEFFISDRNAFALNFLKFRVSTYLGLRLGIPILRMAKIRLWSLIDRGYTPEYIILRIVGNKEVNQSRGVTCYSSGFTYHLRQLVRFDNINESCCVRVPRVL